MSATKTRAPAAWANIPAELRELRQWVLWRLVPRDDDGKPTKEPRRAADPRRKASSTDPATWATYAQAVAAYERSAADGIGFVFTGTPFAGVDLDHVRDAATGVILPEAQAVRDGFDTYAELSQSRTGLHIITRATMPDTSAKEEQGHRVATAAGWEVEAYSTGRYFTCTGERLGDVVDVREGQAQLDALCARYFARNGNGTGEREHEREAGAALPLGDADLIAVLLRSNPGFADLWAGDHSAYPSASEGRAALLTHLAWLTGDDAARMDSLFRSSGLMGPKWERADLRETDTAAAIACNAGKRYTGTGGTGAGSNGKRGNVASGSAQAPAQADAQAPAVSRADLLEDRSDSGNAAVFVRLMGERVRHVGTWDTWVVYDGRRWQRDATHGAERLMGEALLSRFDEAKAAATAGDDETAKQAGRWAAGSRSAAKIAAALQVARSDSRVTARAEDFDHDGYMFNVQNGTLDLRTGQLRRHDPADLLTKLAPVDFDPGARSGLWERVLGEATDGDVDLMTALQRFAGYALTGDAREEMFAILYGAEATMKSTYLAALESTWGDYAIAGEPEAFLSRVHVGGPRDDVAGMEGARLVVVAEFDRGRKMAEALLKQLTGGDRIRARHLYQTAREFAFTAKLAFHTNHVPRMSDDDGAVWRRAWVIPFTHTIPEDKRDPSVKATLTDPAQSGAAILAWAVRGCLEWQRHGLGKRPPAVAHATRAVRESMDPLGEFIDESCVTAPHEWIAASDLRTAYESWARAAQVKPVGWREWGERLRARGFVQTREKSTRKWEGISLG